MIELQCPPTGSGDLLLLRFAVLRCGCAGVSRRNIECEYGESTAELSGHLVRFGPLASTYPAFFCLEVVRHRLLANCGIRSTSHPTGINPSARLASDGDDSKYPPGFYAWK